MKNLLLFSTALVLNLFLVSCVDDYNDLPVNQPFSKNEISNRMSTIDNEEETRSELEQNPEKRIPNNVAISDVSGELAQIPVKRANKVAISDVSGELAQIPVNRANKVTISDVSGELGQIPVKRANKVAISDVSGELGQIPVK